jgi:predicted RNase H-like HicB family nuclease
MIQTFHTTIQQENDVYIAQCLELDLCAEGQTPQEALMNLRESLMLHFEELRPFLKIYLRTIEV